MSRLSLSAASLPASGWQLSYEKAGAHPRCIADADEAILAATESMISRGLVKAG